MAKIFKISKLEEILNDMLENELDNIIVLDIKGLKFCVKDYSFKNDVVIFTLCESKVSNITWRALLEDLQDYYCIV